MDYYLCIFVSTQNVKMEINAIMETPSKNTTANRCINTDSLQLKKIKPLLLTEHFLIIIISEMRQHLVNALTENTACYRLICNSRQIASVMCPSQQNFLPERVFTECL